MEHDEPLFGDMRLSLIECIFATWPDTGNRTMRGLLINTSPACPISWQLTSRWQPRDDHEDGPYTDRQREDWDRELREHQP
jgi:hypothetical protein